LFFEERYPTKKYLIEHPLYEIEMYLYTYQQLRSTVFEDMFLFNTFWNAHNVALRNLMSFFSICGSSGEHEIRYDNFSFSENPSGRKRRSNYYSAISKAINHVTTYRFDGFNGKMLDEYVNEAREKLYPEIRMYISTFIDHLETTESILYQDEEGRNIDISAELKNNDMKNLIATIRFILKDLEHQSELSKTNLMCRLPIIPVGEEKN